MARVNLNVSGRRHTQSVISFPGKIQKALRKILSNSLHELAIVRACSENTYVISIIVKSEVIHGSN
jgi:hypothetical protein